MHTDTSGVTLHSARPELSLGAHCTVVPEGLGHQLHRTEDVFPPLLSSTVAVTFAQVVQSNAAAHVSVGVGMQRLGVRMLDHRPEHVLQRRKSHINNQSVVIPTSRHPDHKQHHHDHDHDTQS